MIRQVRISTTLAILLVPVGGWIASRVTTFGRSVDPALMTAIAEVLPLLLVAGIVQLSFVEQHLVREQGWNPLVNAWSGGIGRAYFFGFLIGEGTALYALAEQKTTTFLVVTPCIAIVLFLADVTLSSKQKLASGSTAIETGPEFIRQTRLAHAAALRKRAALIEDEFRDDTSEGSAGGLSPRPSEQQEDH